MNFKKYITEIVSVLFILLWVYAAISKLLDYNTFSIELSKSPLITDFSKVVAIGIPLIELILAFMLLMDKTKFLALISSTVLMVCFTVYLIIILNFSYYIPCSCGGILGKLGYTAHAIFNIIFIFLGIIAIVFHKDEKQNTNKYESKHNFST